MKSLLFDKKEGIFQMEERKGGFACKIITVNQRRLKFTRLQVNLILLTKNIVSFIPLNNVENVAVLCSFRY